MNQYNPQEIEPKWQQRWEESQIFVTPDTAADRENYYLLVEYPYPSGNLHIGHWYAFAVPDILARKKRMEGYNVLFPMGFDSFGLPAENAAIKHGLDPREWTYKNIDYMTMQLKRMGNSFDWTRKVVASDPEYYKWTQWLFLQLFNAGLAYRKKAEVNWCPKDMTVLANEQVVDNACERCGTEVVKKQLEQWFVRITDYAEKLLEGLDGLDWPEEIKDSQRNWIGKSEGAELEFTVVGHDAAVKVFTTRPDTLFGATYMVLAPEHPHVAQITTIEQRAAVESYVKEASKKDEMQRTDATKEKTGVFTGAYAVNPANGREVPIWIADYVLGSYGTGAIMAVPAHDERDHEFAKKFNLEIVQVIAGEDTNVDEAAHSGSGVLMNSGEFDGMLYNEAKAVVTEKVGGKLTNNYKLRDWLISRQRYWGTPIPVVYDPEGKPHAIPDEHLPWTLPTDVDFTPTGEAPLASSKELHERTTRIFGEGWTPEVDTMDTFIDSSWYYLRYLDSQNDQEFAARDKQEKWMPVDRYSGGAEHTTMHLLYSRFFNQALHDLGLVPTAEPYKVRMNRGLILGPDGHKMSKSKGNVIDPDENVQEYGADAVKMYLAFIGPYNEPGTYPWDMGAINGVRRFLERVWKLRAHVQDGEGELAIEKELHRTTVKVAADIEVMKFNTAISALMVLVNTMEKAEALSRAQFEMLLKVLSPFAPHMTEELWHDLGNDTFITNEEWPAVNEAYLVHDTVVIGVQVNGKMRGTIELAPDASEDDAVAAAKEVQTVVNHLEGKSIVKIIYVPGKILNMIAK